MRCYLTLILTFILGYTNSQITSEYNINQYTIAEGLSQNNLNKIFQDNIGYIWITSQSGVDRLDGYTIFNYNPKNIYDTSSIKEYSNIITQDQNGNIWIGSRNGVLSINNRKLSNWKNYSIVNEKAKGLSIYKTKKIQSTKFEITGIEFKKNSDIIYASTKGMGLFSLDLKTKEVINYWIGDTSINDLLNNEIHCLKALTNNILLLGTSNGLIIYNIIKKKIEKHLFYATNTAESVRFNNIILTNSKEAFVTSDQGLYNINLIDYKTTIYTSNSSVSLPEKNVTAIFYDSLNNKIWLAIKTKGVYSFDLQSRKSFIKLNSNSNDNIKINESIITDILIDKQKNIWLNSYGNGLYKLSPKKKYFKLYSKLEFSDYKINSTICKGAFIDSNNHIWIGSNDPGGGVIEVNRVENKITNHLFNFFPKEQKIWNFNQDYTGNIWVFTKSIDDKNEGIIFFKKSVNANKFNRVGSSQELLKKNNISNTVVPSSTFLYLTKNGDLLLNASQIIHVANKKGDLIFKPFNGLDKLKKIDSSLISIIKRERNNKTYVLTEQGIYYWNESNGEIDKLTKNIVISEISRLNNNYMSIVNDSLVFIPTYGFGLLKIDLKKQTKTFITKENSNLSSQFIYDVHFDNNKYLWLSSNKGIIRLNIFDNTTHNFTKEEGIQDYEFNSKSQYVSSRGEIVIAGVNGVNSFYPFENKQITLPNLVIQRIVFSDKSKKLIHASSSKDVITIPHTQNKFSIDFISLNFNKDEKINYEFRLEGYDKKNEWFQPRNYNNNDYQPSASYENLPPGQYTFKVRSYLIDNKLLNKEASLLIYIEAAPWNTKWAYLLYLITLISFVIVVINIYERRKINALELQRKNEDLIAAKRLQSDMLPKKLPKRNDLQIAVALKTSSEVGGDYYDFFEQEDNSLFVVSGDATGHGIASGMMVSVTKAGLNGVPASSPELLLENLNNVIRRVGIKNLKMSLSVAHVKDDRILLSSSAMPPIYYFSKNTKDLEEIPFSSLPLGSLKNEKYSLIEKTFNKGDIIIFTSDGIPEAINKKGEILGYSRLFKFIAENINKEPEMLKSDILKLADDWVGGNNHTDDISIVIIKKIN